MWAACCCEHKKGRSPQVKTSAEQVQTRNQSNHQKNLSRPEVIALVFLGDAISGVSLYILLFAVSLLLFPFGGVDPLFFVPFSFFLPTWR